MESLESRMGRLTPEQRKEVEDFVDFLLLKNNFGQNPPAAAPPPPVLMNAPPVLSAEPALFVQAPSFRMQDPIVHEETQPAGSSEPTPSSIREIAVDDEDGYMDYGRFEQSSTPADESVKSVKRKIIARENDQKSGHLLDWVD